MEKTFSQSKATILWHSAIDEKLFTFVAKLEAIRCIADLSGSSDTKNHSNLLIISSISSISYSVFFELIIIVVQFDIS